MRLSRKISFALTILFVALYIWLGYQLDLPSNQQIINEDGYFMLLFYQTIVLLIIVAAGIVDTIFIAQDLQDRIKQSQNNKFSNNGNRVGSRS